MLANHQRSDERTATWRVRFALLAPAVAMFLGGACHRIHDGQIDAFLCMDEGAFGPPACPEGFTCVAGRCADVGLPFGAECNDDDACAEGTACLDPADFGANGRPRCSRLCCSSAECGDSEDAMVCWLPESATGGLCWPVEEVGRALPGAGEPGEMCRGDGDCRSAICDNGFCVGACCGDSFCRGGQVCRVKLSALSTRDAFACGASGGPTIHGVCNSDPDCRSGQCVDARVETPEGLRICGEPCCSSTDCVEVEVNNEVRPVACDVSESGLRSCSRVMEVGAVAPVGAPCVDSGDCRSGVCLEIDGERLCSDSCCDDASCGDTSAFACVPIPEEGTWALRCVPK